MISQLATIPQTVPVPLPRVNVTIRPGVMSDVPFLDSLQKLHTKQVGWRVPSPHALMKPVLAERADRLVVDVDALAGGVGPAHAADFDGAVLAEGAGERRVL
jgi:hypothetical protein